MVFRHRFLVALFCALALFVAQQGAFAHALGHLGSGPACAAETGASKDGGDGDSLSAAHLCVTCLAFDVCAAPPLAAVLPGIAAVPAAPPRIAVVVTGITLQPAPPYSSRAPPVFL